MVYGQTESKHSDTIAIIAAVILAIGALVGIVLGMALKKEGFSFSAMFITWVITLVVAGEILILHWFLLAIENINDTLRSMHHTLKNIDNKLPEKE